MKKTGLILTIALIAILLFSTTSAMAYSTVGDKPTGTPGPPPGVPKGPPSDSPGKSANAGLQGKPENYRGTISAIDGSNITVLLRDGTEVTIAISGDTRVKGPGHGNAAVTAEVGMNVMVQARRDQDGNLTARSIHIIPGKPARMHYVGEVTEYTEGSSITILAHDGNSYTFTLTAETKILPAERAGELAVGSQVTIIAPRNPASLGWVAQGIVVHPAATP